MESYTLTRQIPRDQGFEVVVAGGGPAGVAAAIAAGRQGAKVLLVEATGCLGGMGTSGLVCAFDPMANGERNLVGGIMLEVVETMYERGMLRPGTDPNQWRKFDHEWTQFHPEGLKLILDEMVTDAGVEVRFFTKVVDADCSESHVDGVILHNVEGFRYVPARTFIDCTGDAVLADLCGVPCREPGRDTPRPMPATLASLHTGLSFARMIEQGPALQKAVDDDHFTQPDRHFPGMSRIGRQIGYLNGGHLFNLDALRCRSLSDGMMLGRKIAQEYLEFFRKYVPECEDMELVTTAALMGVRESRRIVGEYELNFADYQARRHFPDQIGLFNKFVDVHPYDCSREELERFHEEKDKSGRLAPGESFGIPYGILVPRGWANLWVAGRCTSSDVKVQGSIRVMPAAAMMGQAAGTAAVQSMRRDQTACGLDTEELVQSLREQNAYLPQEQLSSAMTRA